MMTSQTFRFFITVIGLALTLSALSCGRTQEQDREKNIASSLPLENLKKELKRADTFNRLKYKKLDSLKTCMKNAEESFEMSRIAVDLSAEYRQFDSDSAIYFARIALDALPDDSPDSLILKAKLVLVNALGTSGIFPEALRQLDDAKSHLRELNDHRDYWKSARILYSSMMNFMKNDNDFTDDYRRLYIISDDSLLSLMSESDPFYQFISAERLVSAHKWEQAQRQLEALLNSNPLESNIFGMSAYQMAEVYKNTGDFKNYENYLALAALSDVRGTVKEGMALPTLASYLYEKGDIDNAFTFITTAFNDASRANIRMRTVALADNMTMIDKAYRDKISDSRAQMLVYLIIACIFLLLAVVLFFMMVKIIRSSKEKERKLALSTEKLQAYIGNFIELSSSYASRLDQLTKLIGRKINAGQTDDLLKLLESGRFSLDDNTEFYKLIDKAILDIYPDFVESINTLLVPEKRFNSIGDKDEILNPELRIYAFVRLGVEQSIKIAQILHYSVNTVYAYRNKTRNRAIDRENFDVNVAALNNDSI